MSMLSSSNPVLSDQSLGRVLNAPDLARSGTASVQGVMAKTGFCTVLAVGAGAVGYTLAQTYPAMFMISMIASLVVSLILFFVLMAKPSAAIVAAPTAVLCRRTHFRSRYARDSGAASSGCPAR